MKSKTPFAITLLPGSSLTNKTGSWRTLRPVYVDRLPPCNSACPAGENIQQWLFHAEEGNYEKAWSILMDDNPFPATMGRICYHPCETQCNRGKLDEAVNIHAVERFLGDQALAMGWKVSPKNIESGKRILVIGSGPSGLSSAYHLRRLGHEVTIYEAAQHPGGMMRYGIPKYRLPRDILDHEIERIQKMRIEIVLNRNVVDVVNEKEKGRFDAVFMAIGAHIGKRVEIPARDTGTVYDAVQFLKRVEENPSECKIGRRVAVYGGGNTAMDVARTVKRLGAEEALIIYRRDMAHAPAHMFEVEEALEEGVVVHWLRTIKSMVGSSFNVEVMKLNDKGYPEPTGTYETLEADTLILALGQNVDTSLLKSSPLVNVLEDGSVAVDDQMMTSHPGIFAGGDMVPLERTATVAIGHGKKAARCIDAFLCEKKYVPFKKHELAEFQKLNPWYYSDAPKSQQAVLSRIRRLDTFEEVVHGLDANTALFESRRCLSCGNCFECDNCFGVCPDNAVFKLGQGQRYQFNYDYCKGCGLCAQECPCGAIQMINEET